MKVFISWSGETSKGLAEALREWLPAVIQAVNPYFSPDDVSKGSRWSSEISKELEDSAIGIICLTKENLEAPWIMFEAGALSKKLDESRVCPILFGLDPTDIKGPLVQFQASRFQKQDLKKLIKMINDQLGEAALDAETVDSVFEMWWPKLEKTVNDVMSKAKTDTKSAERSDRELLEEILNLTRSTAKDVRTVSRVTEQASLAAAGLPGYTDDRDDARSQRAELKILDKKLRSLLSELRHERFPLNSGEPDNRSVQHGASGSDSGSGEPHKD